MNDFNPTHTVTGLEKIIAAAGSFGQVAMAISSVKSAI